jgi:hypothetical protein
MESRFSPIRRAHYRRLAPPSQAHAALHPQKLQRSGERRMREVRKPKCTHHKDQ